MRVRQKIQKSDMVTDIRKRIKNLSPNHVINIILVLFGVILVVRSISLYSDYQKKVIGVKNETRSTLNNVAVRSTREIFEFARDPVRVTDLDHWMAK